MRLFRWLPVAGEAACGLLLFGAILKVGSYTGLVRLEYSDVHVYRRYGEAVAAGRVPYRDFDVEYPPGALPFFILPALLGHGATAYRRLFVAEMSSVLFCMLAALRVTAGRTALAIAVLATGALGSVTVVRFDLAAALLTALALLCLLRQRPNAAGLALGAAVAVKGYPAVMLPVVAIYVARARGKRAAFSACALAAAVVVVAYAPFVAMAPLGVERSFDAQLARPLEIESSGGILYAIGDKLIGTPSRCCAYSFSGGPSEAVAATSAVLGVALLLVVWVRFFRSSASEGQLWLASGAAVATAVGFAKVFSPQYVLWLVPLFVAFRGGRRVAIALLSGTCVLTAAVFPNHWKALLAFHWTPVLVVLLRDLLIISSAGFLTASVRPLKQQRSRRPDSNRGPHHYE